MRVVVFAESFLPHMNGVTNSILHTLRHLQQRGHEALVVAPHAAGDADTDTVVHGASVVRVPSLPAPGYPQVRVASSGMRRLGSLLRRFQPDVAHLASPFMLGWQGLLACERIDVPTVAVYQTDLAGYASRYGVPSMQRIVERHIARLHTRATLTLAPSTAARSDLERLGVTSAALWGRGVESARFHPGRRSASLRSELAPNGEIIVGYVGRLAPEKKVGDLHALVGMPGIRLVIVGDGPSRPELKQQLPGAVFLGFRGGSELAEIVASFDLFVHPGEHETFCQTVQEALASGVPVVATGRGGPVDLVASGRRAIDGGARAGAAASRPFGPVGPGHPDASPAPAPQSTPHWSRYLALGDSLTEGLSDTSRQRAGEYRGWADRLASLLSHGDDSGIEYANLAVRSKRVCDVVDDQLLIALALRADLVSILVGPNDLVRVRVDLTALADQVGSAIVELTASRATVLVVGVFAPPYRGLAGLRRRYGALQRTAQCPRTTSWCSLSGLRRRPRRQRPQLVGG